MSKYVTFLSQLQPREKENSHVNTFDGSSDHNDISFDQLMDKGEENASPCIDKVFNPIELNRKEVIKEREVFNRRLEEKLSKSKDKYKKDSVILNVEKQQKSELNLLKKQNEELLTRMDRLKSDSEQEKALFKKRIEDLNKKCEILNKQLIDLKIESDMNIKSKSEAEDKFKKFKEKAQKVQQAHEQTEKKLRIKEKQMKKLEELQEQRSAYYQSLFNQKETEIGELNEELAKRTDEIYSLRQMMVKNQNKETEINKKLEIFLLQNKTIKDQLSLKVETIQKMTNVLHEAIGLMEKHLRQPTDGQSNFSSGGFSTQYKSVGRKSVDEAFLRYFLTLTIQTIERNEMIENKKKNEIKNFQGIYEMQLEDLDSKMSHLIEENRHLRIKNDEINRSFGSVGHKESHQCQFNSEQFKKYMSTARAHHSKIREEVLSNKTAQVIQQIERARKVYKQASLRSQSMTNLRKNNVCQSQSNLFKRSRRSLSWKKPPEVLKQYV